MLITRASLRFRQWIAIHTLREYTRTLSTMSSAVDCSICSMSYGGICIRNSTRHSSAMITVIGTSSQHSPAA